MRTPQHPPIGWRIPPELKTEVATYAQQTRRSVVGAAEHLLRLALTMEAARIRSEGHQHGEAE